MYLFSIYIKWTVVESRLLQLLLVTVNTNMTVIIIHVLWKCEMDSHLSDDEPTEICESIII